MAEMYGFSERSARRIAKAVKKVEGMAGDTKRPAYTPEMAGSDYIVDRHVGTFTGVWAKDTTADVTVTADNGNTYTETATNYFSDVGASGGTSDCVILLAGSEWVLVSASPIDTQPFFLVGTFDGAWSKGAYKTVTTNNSGTVNALNLFADVNDSGDSGVSCAIARDGLWHLIAAECG